MVMKQSVFMEVNGRLEEISKRVKPGATERTLYNLVGKPSVEIRRHVFRNSSTWRADFYHYKLTDEQLREKLLDVIAGATRWIQELEP